MEFYINFGKDKNKENHISKFNNKTKLEFSIVVSQLNKYTNGREYAYLKAESWNWNVIEKLEENKKFKMGEFYFRFYKDEKDNINWVVVIKSLQDTKSLISNKKDMFIDDQEFKDMFNDNNDNNNNNKEQDWELDL